VGVATNNIFSESSFNQFILVGNG